MISKNLSLSLCLIAFMLACHGSKEDEIAKNQDMTLQDMTLQDLSHANHNHEFRRLLDQLSPLFEKICLLDQTPYCLANVKRDFATTKASFDESYYTIDLSRLDACIENVSGTGEKYFKNYVKSCGLVIPTKKEDDLCLSNLDCQVGLLNCDLVWNADHLCSEYRCVYLVEEGEDPYYGGPVSLKQVGEDCTITQECVKDASCIWQNDSYYCVSNNQINIIQENEICQPKVEILKCIEGLFCVTEYTNPQKSYCKPLANKDEACYFTEALALHSNCVEGYYCHVSRGDLAGICKAIPSQNEPCGRSRNDVNLCDFNDLLTCQNATCMPTSLAHESCQSDDNCLNGNIKLKCVDQICQPINKCIDK
jgi:hypothetical protein